jgi:hypothetical protein
MSVLREGFCDGCNKLIATDHPLGLCPECDIRLNTQSAKESAWKRTPLSGRATVRLLQTATFVLGFVCLSLLLWVLKPSYYRIVRHPLAFCLLIGAAIAAYSSYMKARKLKRDIDASADAVVGWYTTRK